jgi:hypothetical protein
MLLYTGHKIVINLVDGSAIRGRLGWPWARGCLRILDAETIDDGAVDDVPGVLIVPKARIMLVQVL